MALPDPDADSPKPVLSTMWSGRNDGPEWPREVHVVSRRDYRWFARWLFEFIRAARGREAVILRGTVPANELYADLVAAAVLRLVRNPARIVISDATIDVGSRQLERRVPQPLRSSLRRLTRHAVRSLDSRRTRWCVLSTAEVDTFPAVWGVRPENVVFTAFSNTLHDREIFDGVRQGQYLFSGGNSLRDYQPLLDAVTDTGTPTIIATTWSPPYVPAHVAVGAVNHEQFMMNLRDCFALVLPLQHSVRSTGQQTYLNAMALGKPVIVTDAPGVRDYVVHGVTGLVCEATAEGLRAAINQLTDERNPTLGKELGARAAAAVRESYEPQHYRQRLLAVALDPDLRWPTPARNGARARTRDVR